MQHILLTITMLLLSMASASAQSNIQSKSKEELIDYIKENIETLGNFMGTNYRVAYDAAEPNHLRIGENTDGDIKWFKIDLSKASFGTSVSILATGKENFFLSFRKDITIKEKNNKNAGLDVAFFKRKDKREADYGDLIESLTMAFTSLINKCRS